MYVPVQLFLPSVAPTVVSGVLRLHVGADGLITVGHEVKVPGSDEVLALGVTPALTRQEADSCATDLLAYYLRVLPSVVDAPPFD